MSRRCPACDGEPMDPPCRYCDNRGSIRVWRTTRLETAMLVLVTAGVLGIVVYRALGY